MKSFAIFLIVALGLGCVSTAKKKNQVFETKEGKSVKTFMYYSHDSRSTLHKAAASDRLDPTIEKLKKGEETPEKLARLAALYAATGKLKSAKREANKALLINYKNREAKSVLAQVAFREGKYDVANAILGRLGGDKAKESDVLNLYALVQVKLGHVDHAIIGLQRAIRTSPEHLAARMNLGLVYLKYNLFASATKEFEAVLKKDPDNLDAKLHLGVAYAVSGKSAQAEKLYQSVGANTSNNAIVEYNHAVLKSRQKKYKEAIERLKRFVKNHPKKMVSTSAAIRLIEEIRVYRAASDGISDQDIDDLIADVNRGGKAVYEDDEEFSDNPLLYSH